MLRLDTHGDFHRARRVIGAMRKHGKPLCRHHTPQSLNQVGTAA